MSLLRLVDDIKPGKGMTVLNVQDLKEKVVIALQTEAN